MNPSVVRIRKELSWDDALLDYSKELKQTGEKLLAYLIVLLIYWLMCLSFVIIVCHLEANIFTVERHSKAARTVKPAKYWSAEKGKHMRAFFEDFAR